MGSNGSGIGHGSMGGDASYSFVGVVVRAATFGQAVTAHVHGVADAQRGGETRVGGVTGIRWNRSDRRYVE
ncbi:hypothetical protein [Nocardia sp. NPDC050793]|uniref:hypothetical protein n=1 Tax=Nocardia sp. NPDC050793 TaxID=3155159 RepID=UPI0033F4FE4A